jgi:hypothetical protein
MYTVHRTSRTNKTIRLLILLLLVTAVTLVILFYLSNNNLNNTKEQLTNTQHDLCSTQLNLSETQIWLTSNQTQLSRMTSGYGYTLNDPTFNQMKAFLAQDQTDKHAYKAMKYNCFNFSADTVINASKEHIRCGIVYVMLFSTAHACVVFNTTDDGLVFVEPQTDELVNLQRGEAYWASISSVKYPSLYHDMVTMYTIIW